MEIEARLAVTSLMARYGNAYDLCETEAWLDTFTEDGLFQAYLDDPETPQTNARGRAELRQFIEGSARARQNEATMSLHLLSAIEVIEESAEEMRLRTRIIISRTQQDGSAIAERHGTYFDVVRRIGNEWRFAERVMRLDPAVIAARPGQ